MLGTASFQFLFQQLSAGWEAIIKDDDIQMFKRRWNGESIIDHVMSHKKRTPLNSSYYATNFPAVYAAAERIFGSWGAAIEACGLDYSKIRKYRTWSKKGVIEEIHKRHRAKKSLTSSYIQNNEKRLYMASVKRFKSWGAAVRASGIDYSKVMLRRKMSKTDIKEEILALYSRHVDLAYPNMREKYQYLLAAGMKKLGNGSWDQARKKCGIKINYRLPKHKRSKVGNTKASKTARKR